MKVWKMMGIFNRNLMRCEPWYNGNHRGLFFIMGIWWVDVVNSTINLPFGEQYGIWRWIMDRILWTFMGILWDIISHNGLLSLYNVISYKITVGYYGTGWDIMVILRFIVGMTQVYYNVILNLLILYGYVAGIWRDVGIYGDTTFYRTSPSKNMAITKEDMGIWWDILESGSAFWVLHMKPIDPWPLSEKVLGTSPSHTPVILPKLRLDP